MSRLAGCTGKLPYLTWPAAAGTVRRMRRSRKVHRPVEVYRCRYCGQFHVGEPRK